MKHHTKPCKTCPFLKGQKFFFHPDRADEIIQAYERDSHLTCHSTVDYSGDGGGRVTKNSLLCVGGIICAQRSGQRPSQAARVAVGIGLLNWSAIERQVATNTDVYEDFDAFLKAQEH